jgi:hypothetical protein
VVAGMAMSILALLAVPVVAFLKAKGLYLFAQGLATACILMLFLGRGSAHGHGRAGRIHRPHL